MEDRKFTGVLVPRTLEEQDDLNDIQKKIDEYEKYGPLVCKANRPSKAACNQLIVIIFLPFL